MRILVFQASFHIPLHRYYAVFLRQAVKYQGLALRDLVPDTETLMLMMQHPLRVQTVRTEARMSQENFNLASTILVTLNLLCYRPSTK